MISTTTTITMDTTTPTMMAVLLLESFESGNNVHEKLIKVHYPIY